MHLIWECFPNKSKLEGCIPTIKVHSVENDKTNKLKTVKPSENKFNDKMFTDTNESVPISSISTKVSIYFIQSSIKIQYLDQIN